MTPEVAERAQRNGHLAAAGDESDGGVGRGLASLSGRMVRGLGDLVGDISRGESSTSATRTSSASGCRSCG